MKRATSVTLNQVRAVKYLPIAVHCARTDEWYIVPAHVVVAAVSQRRRGQHTENPFESSDEYPELRVAGWDYARE